MSSIFVFKLQARNGSKKEFLKQKKIKTKIMQKINFTTNRVINMLYELFEDIQFKDIWVLTV